MTINFIEKVVRIDDRYHGRINNKYGQTLTRPPTESPKKRSDFGQTILSADNYADFFVGSNFNPPGSEVRDSEILNVFLRLKLTPALNSTECVAKAMLLPESLQFNHC